MFTKVGNVSIADDAMLWKVNKIWRTINKTENKTQKQLLFPLHGKFPKNITLKK